MSRVKQAQIAPVANFSELLTRCAEAYGEKCYLTYHRNKETVRLSYAAFAKLAFSVRNALIAGGLSGKSVALIGDTSPEWLATFLGTVLAGGRAVPLDRELSESEIPLFLEKAKAEAVFFAPRFATLMENIPSLSCRVRFPAEGESDEAFSSFLATGASVEDAFVESDSTRASVLLFTSGTTGSSKGVLLSEANLITVMNEAHRMLRFGEDEVLLSVLPPHHTYELTCGLLTPMLYGATVCISDGLRYVSKNMKEFRPTAMILVPLFVNRFYKTVLQIAERNGELKKLLGAQRVANTLYRMGFDLRRRIFAKVLSAFGGRLTRIVCGGAPLDPAMVERFSSFGITVAQGYGITECAPLISVVPFGISNPTSCGKLIGAMQCYIDKENPTDPYGEIVVKGPNVMLGYLDDEEATREVLHMGWFHTGDYGYMDENGYLYITGRKKNVIVCPGGKNVFPEEIEEYLERIDLVGECVVVGRPSENGEQMHLVALIYPNEEVAAKEGLDSPDAIRTTLLGEIRELNVHLPAYKKITDVELRNHPFEKTTTRKIKRAGLQ